MNFRIKMLKLPDSMLQVKHELSGGSSYEKGCYPLDVEVAYSDYLAGTEGRTLVMEEIRRSEQWNADNYSKELDRAQQYLSIDGGKARFIRDCKIMERDDSCNSGWKRCSARASIVSSASTSGDNASSSDRDNKDKDANMEKEGQEKREEVWERHVVAR